MYVNSILILCKTKIMTYYSCSLKHIYLKELTYKINYMLPLYIQKQKIWTVFLYETLVK